MSDDAALSRDAAIYARQYGVDEAEAARRIKLMVSAQTVADSEEAGEQEDLVAAFFDHGREFKLVVETAGTAKAKKVRPVAIRGKPGEQIDLPVEYRKVNRPTKSAIRKIFREKNNMIERLFPEALITSYDERGGILSLTFEQGKPIADREKKVAQLQNAIGVPVKILWGPADTRIGMRRTSGLSPQRNQLHPELHAGLCRSGAWAGLRARLHHRGALLQRLLLEGAHRDELHEAQRSGFSNRDRRLAIRLGRARGEADQGGYRLVPQHNWPAYSRFYVRKDGNKHRE
jgi:hypothetical protein